MQVFQQHNIICTYNVHTTDLKWRYLLLLCQLYVTWGCRGSHCTTGRCSGAPINLDAPHSPSLKVYMMNF